MSEEPIHIAAPGPDILGESPWWDWKLECLWWIDLRGRQLRRLWPLSGEVESWTLPRLPGAVVGRASGGVVLALSDGIYSFDPDRGETAPCLIAALTSEAPDMRLNDAKCDASGALWFGTMRDFGKDDAGGLWRIAPQGSPKQLLWGLRIPNALTFSLDGTRLYFCDTKAGDLIWLDPDKAEAAPQVFATAGSAPGLPDGACVDEEGFLWNARWGGNCLARYAPDGRLDRLVETPMANPSSVAFGGPELDCLYVTSARQGLPAPKAIDGALIRLDLGVCGLREPYAKI